MSPQTTQLKIAVQAPESWSRRLSITVPADRVRQTRGAVREQIARSARMPGFRKGRLPEKIVEQRFGPSIDQETVDRTIQEAYREALETEGLAPITQGKVDKVDYQPGADLSFEVEVEVRPEIDLAQVSGFTVARPTSDVTDEEVDALLQRLRDERGSWESATTAEHPGIGQEVTVEIVPLDAAEGESSEPQNYRFVIGEGQAIPDVEDAIKTLAPAEEGEFTVRFPDDFPDEGRRGVEQKLRIKLVEIRQKSLPELDDEFAKAVGDFADLSALRERVAGDLATEARERSEGAVRQQLIDRILEANPFAVPGSMVERYLDYMTGHSHADGHEHKHTPEEEERITRIRQTLRPQAEWGLKRTLIVEQIAEKEGLAATQDEIDARVEAVAAANDRSPSEVWLQLEKSGRLEMIEREITEDKVFNFLLARNTVE